MATYLDGNWLQPKPVYSDDYGNRVWHALKGVLNPDELVGRQMVVSFDPGILFNKKDVEATMNLYNAANEADQALRAKLGARKEAALLEKKLALVDQYGVDTLVNTTVLVFDKKFTADGKIYTYAALKTNNTWYVTGNRGLFGFREGSWDEFVLALVSGEYPVSAEEVAICSDLSPLLDSDTSYTELNRNESTDF